MNTKMHRPPLAQRIRSAAWWKAHLAFFPTLAWNLLVGRILCFYPWWNDIDDHVILGGLPFAEDADMLSTRGVVGVVNTCEEYLGPVKAYDQFGIEQLYLPTLDYTLPTLEAVQQAVDFIGRYVDAGGKVYVHCKAGRARSAVVAACWLIARHNLTPEQAQQRLLKRRRQVKPTTCATDVVQEFYRLSQEKPRPTVPVKQQVTS